MSEKSVYRLLAAEPERGFEPRLVRLLEKVKVGERSDWRWADLEPPLVHDQGQIQSLVLGTRHYGFSLDDLNDLPLDVYVCRVKGNAKRRADYLKPEDVSILYWGLLLEPGDQRTNIADVYESLSAERRRFRPMTLFDLTMSLCGIDSTSGNESYISSFLSSYLMALGWTVERQQVSENQNNVIATLNDTPRVWFSTHMDTVPPFIPPTEDDEKIYGRGSCDAKGIIAAQITAAEQLRKEGIEDIGLLYTVEEERASTGAKAANLHPFAAKCEYMINGEPTDNDLAIGSKGTFRLMIRTTGKAAHSAYPEEGDSAIEKLLDILEDIRHTKFPDDEIFGETTVNIGTIDGGAALNVIPPAAEAGLAIRLTTKKQPIDDALRSIVRDRGEIEILSFSEPVRMLDVDGFKKKVVRFTTDIPHMPNWGKPLLLGPGSILVAHTKDEFVLKKDLETAISLYIGLAKTLLKT